MRSETFYFIRIRALSGPKLVPFIDRSSLWGAVSTTLTAYLRLRTALVIALGIEICSAVRASIERWSVRTKTFQIFRRVTVTAPIINEVVASQTRPIP